MNGTLVCGGVDEDGHDKNGEMKTSLSSFSVYVGNLPFSMTKNWIRETFKCFGDISDIFLSRKPKRTSSSRFAFVHFSSVAGAHIAIRELNGMLVDGCHLLVVEALEKKSLSERV